MNMWRQKNDSPRPLTATAATAMCSAGARAAILPLGTCASRLQSESKSESRPGAGQARTPRLGCRQRGRGRDRRAIRNTCSDNGLQVSPPPQHGRNTVAKLRPPRENRVIHQAESTQRPRESLKGAFGSIRTQPFRHPLPSGLPGGCGSFTLGTGDPHPLAEGRPL